MSLSIIEQKRLFIEGSLKRIDDACEALELLRMQLSETSYLEAISSICHKLQGSSGFFNMPEFSQAAIECERASIELLKRSSELNAADIEQLASQLSRMTQMLKDTPLEQSDSLTAEAVSSTDAEDLEGSCSEPGLSLKFLLIEDDELVSENIEEMLTIMLDGAEVDVTPLGSQAMEKFGENKYDLVILDGQLPDTTGLDLLKKMKAIRPETRVLVMTGISDKQVLNEYRDAGAEDIMKKPFPLARFVEQIKLMLGLNK